MVTISLCAIFRNDAEFVGEFVEQFRPFADEWILINTGSSDGTDQKLKQLLPDVVIHPFNWNNDFSSARNAALDKATMDWIFFPDLDERIREPELTEIRIFLNQIDAAVGGLIMECLNTADLNWQANSPSIHSIHQVIRFFRNNRSLRYQNQIHESIEPAIGSEKLQLLQTKFKIYHLGYAGFRYGQKIKRNEALIDEYFKNFANSKQTIPPYLIYYYCQHHWGNRDEILDLLISGLSNASGKLKIFFLEGCLCWHQAFGDEKNTRKYFLELSRNSPDSIILTLKEAREAFEKQDLIRSLQLYTKTYKNSHMEGFIQVFRPEILMNLGLLHACQNELPDAMKYWLEYVELFGMDHTVFWQLAKLYYLSGQITLLDELFKTPPSDITKISSQAAQELLTLLNEFENKSNRSFKDLRTILNNILNKHIALEI